VIYTRQLTVPVLLSVRRTLELLNADVLAVRQCDDIRSDAEAMVMINQMSEHLAQEHKYSDQWCLLTLDIRNIWSVPFQLQFTIRKYPILNDTEGDNIEDNPVVAATTISLQPGAAKR
jgi:hypothetical protein